MPEKIFKEWLEELPNMKKLMNQGCYAKLNSTIPPVSIVAWSSITTGKNPADHGVFECLYLDKEDSNRMRVSSSLNMKEKRIWELVSENNKKAISCFVPLTWPLRPYDGILLSGNFTPEGKNFSHPPEIEKEINSVLDKPFLMDIKYFRELSKEQIKDKIRDVSNIHLDVIKYLVKNKEWDFFFGVLTGSDRMNHSFWRYCDEKHRKYDPHSKFKDYLKDYYIFLDKELGKILELLDKDTQVIVLSDHGITRMHNRVSLCDWLIREEYLVLKKGIEIKGPIQLDFSMINWNKTKVFATGAYDGQIFINLKGREPEGIVNIEDYDDIIDELDKKLKKIPGDDGKILDTKIFKKKEFFQGKFKRFAPDIIVYFDDLMYGVNTSIIGNKLLWSPQTALGSDDAGHSRQGIFIMGNSKQKGNLGEISYLDIVPTILGKLGMEIPKEFSGKIIE